MKYFVAHVLAGDAKRYHERLVRALSRTHKIHVPKRHSPPHITIKPPFECGLMGIVQVEKALRVYARSHTAPHYTLKGFGKFGFKTIYWDVQRTSEAVSFVRGCIKYVNKEVRWMPRSPLEGNKLHASVARHLDKKTSARIWKMIKDLTPEYTGRFDTIAVMKKVRNQWVIRTTIRVPRTLQLPLPE